MTGGVAIVTLNRPHRHNSLVPELLDELLDAFGSLGGDDNIRAVVLQAAGRSFSTGGDLLGFFESLDRAGHAQRAVGTLNEVMLVMMRMLRPIVAAVHGIVTGGSLGLVLASDLVVIGSEAGITPWYCEVGFAPDGGWTALLPQLIGRQRTTDILLRNRTITPTEVVDWGLATALEPAEGVQPAASLPPTNAPLPHRESVRAANRLVGPDLDELRRRLDVELRGFVAQIVTEEAAAGIERFLGAP